MPSSIKNLQSAVLDEQVLQLAKIIKQRRKVLGISMTSAAESAGMSRVTWHRIEHGEITVTIAAWFKVLDVLGLKFSLVENPGQDQLPSQAVPTQIALSQFPQLQALAWQVVGTDFVTPREALDIYQNNRRHINWDDLQDTERQLIDALMEIFGEQGSV